MIDNMVRDLQLLWRAETLIAKIWVEVLSRRLGLFAVAGLIAALGLGMANVAGLFGLLPVVGMAWAAAIVALADFVLAGIVVLTARGIGPGRDIELALDVRNTAVASLQADARDLKASLDAVGQDIRDTKERIVGFVHNPLDSAAQTLLVPAIAAIIKALRARKAEE
jgi:hypothetical protein